MLLQVRKSLKGLAPVYDSELRKFDAFFASDGSVNSDEGCTGRVGPPLYAYG